MFAPITRSMTFTLGLCGAALSPDLLAETEAEAAPLAPTLMLGATNVTARAWAAPPKIPTLTPPAP
nr:MULTISPECIES: hypothetical protein [unclassified Pseudomonas]